MRIVIAALLVVSAACASMAAAAEVPQEQIQSAVEKLVEKILVCQEADGHFALGHATGQDARMYSQFPQGQTALAVMALQYARPHMKGDMGTSVATAIKKGIAWLSQQTPEAMTYSGGLVTTVFFQENPEKYRKPIDAYAMMLAVSQHATGDTAGQWGYKLAPAGSRDASDTDVAWGDNSNTQVALLGLYNAERAGFQVPKIVWQRAMDHYVRTQAQDGGWGYKLTIPVLRPKPYANMTIASTISLQLCEEMIYAEGHKQCKAPPRSKAVEAGLNWIAANWEAQQIGTDPYGLYALERLGILMGRANIGGHDWYNEGAAAIIDAKQLPYWATPETSYCFAIAFLCRGLEPIIINKLDRGNANDWNNDPYDVKHLTEFLQDRFQLSVQWRIVTLDAPMTLLVKTPILYISGHDKLEFTPQEKERLRTYVQHGGTILAQACCSRKPFDDSIRALAKETFGSEFRPFPASSRIFERMKMKGLTPKPDVLFATDSSETAAAADQGRPAIIFLPHDCCCRWHMGGTGARESLAVGAGIYLFVANECKNMYETAHPGEKPALPPDPEMKKPDPPKPLPEPEPTPPQVAPPDDGNPDDGNPDEAPPPEKPKPQKPAPEKPTKPQPPPTKPLFPDDLPEGFGK